MKTKKRPLTKTTGFTVKDGGGLLPMPMPELPEKQLLFKPMREVSNIDFVKVWMTSKTNQEVADKLHLTPSQTSSKATALRAKGVKLPKKLSVLHDPNSIEALNKIVKRYSK